MRTISAQSITDTVARLCIKANTQLPQDVQAALEKAREEEPWPLAKNTLDLLWSNLGAAKEKDLPICQDTGMACVFVELGTDVHIDGSFEAAIHEGVRRGYTDGYLRKSIVADPLRRGNTGDNTPAAITVHLVDGEGCRITVAPKGAGSENMTTLKMLKPTTPLDEVENAIIHASHKLDHTLLIQIRSQLDEENQQLHFIVQDNGTGMSQETLANIFQGMEKPDSTGGPGSHFAIKNINERLRILYGEHYTFHITSQEGAGTTIHIVLPMQIPYSPQTHEEVE